MSDRDSSEDELREEMDALRDDLSELRGILIEYQQSETDSHSNSIDLSQLPSLGKALHYTNEYGLTAIIGFLEVNVKLLKAGNEAFRFIDPHAENTTRSSVAFTGIKSMSPTLGNVLSDLQENIDEYDISEEGKEEADKKLSSIFERLNTVSDEYESEEDDRSEQEKAIEDMQQTIEEADVGGSPDQAMAEESEEVTEPQEGGGITVDVENEIASIKDDLGKSNDNGVTTEDTE